MKKAFIIAGIGAGDEGKGTCCEYLAKIHQADLIVRYSGGAQAGHTVVKENGARHVFSQFGAASNGIIPTYLHRNVLVDPVGMLKEAKILQDSFGFNQLPLTYIDPDCPIITSLHKYSNIHNKTTLTHGSCGIGIGACRKYSREYPEDTLTAGHLKHLNESSKLVKHKLALLAERLNISMTRVMEDIKIYKEWAAQVKISKQIPKFETAIFEGAQGILIDELYGFHPHTTWSSVGFNQANIVRKELDINNYYNVAVHRIYHTRHGAGPLPTEDKELNFLNQNLVDMFSCTGPMRYGYLDLNLLQYAVWASADVIDTLFISCCDQYNEKLGKVCIDYENCELGWPCSTEDSAANCKKLYEAVPIYNDNLDLAAIINEMQCIVSPNNIIKSFGPTIKDKTQD